MFRSSLYIGTVFHRRVRPAVHQLQYRVFSMLIDLDELSVLDNRLRGFSWNRFNAVSVYDKDFGLDKQQPLREGVESALTDAGISERPASIKLSCYPRIFGFTFNPLSLFYCYGTDGAVFAVVHEVHNTFGERHVYVLPVKSNDEQWIQQRCDKALFVSPFAHMDMHYHFRLNTPGPRQVLAIRLHDDDGLVLTASYSAKEQKLSARSLAFQVLKMPVLCLKVVVGIHWEALRLWIKRVPWFSHVPKSARPPLTKS